MGPHLRSPPKSKSLLIDYWAPLTKTIKSCWGSWRLADVVRVLGGRVRAHINPMIVGLLLGMSSLYMDRVCMRNQCCSKASQLPCHTESPVRSAPERAGRSCRAPAVQKPDHNIAAKSAFAMMWRTRTSNKTDYAHTHTQARQFPFHVPGSFPFEPPLLGRISLYPMYNPIYASARRVMSPPCPSPPNGMCKPPNTRQPQDHKNTFISL